MQYGPCEPARGLEFDSKEEKRASHYSYNAFHVLHFNFFNLIYVLYRLRQEAEVLGDRIGILRDGVLQICGSTMFLKSKCGVGYTLRIFGQCGEEVSQKLEDAHDFLTPVGNLEYTASFSDSHNFPQFFKQLEEIHKDGFSLEVTYCVSFQI